MIRKWYKLEYIYRDASGYSRSAERLFDTQEERNEKLQQILHDEYKKVSFYSMSDIFNCWIEEKT